MTLDVSKPDFLSLTFDNTNQEYNIDYDGSLSKENDIGTHSVAYNVAFVEYSGIATDLSSIFEFQLVISQECVTQTLTNAQIPTLTTVVGELVGAHELPTQTSCGTVSYTITELDDYEWLEMATSANLISQTVTVVPTSND